MALACGGDGVARFALLPDHRVASCWGAGKRGCRRQAVFGSARNEAVKELPAQQDA